MAGPELLASDSHLIVGIDDPTLIELAGVALEWRLYVVFAVRDGRIMTIDDHAHRRSALGEAGLLGHIWS